MSCHSNHQNQENRPITYLALGDSYTIGESVSEPDRWPNQLVKKLNETDLLVSEARILAKTGWTTDELIQAIQDSTLAETYDFVSLLIGVNNQYRGRFVENYQKEFTTLLDIAIKFADQKSSKVFVVSIPDWGITPFAKDRDAIKIANEIDQFNTIAQEVCKQKKVPFVDITDISRRAQKDLTLLAKDGLHPSGKMYAFWVDRLLPKVIDLIKD